METKTPKASILVVSLLITGMMIVIALGIASSALQSRKASIGSSQSNVAFQNADSGVEIIMQRIKDNVDDTDLRHIDSDGTCDGIYTSPDGKYMTELRDSSGDIIDSPSCGTTAVSAIRTVKSVGYSSQDSRAIEVAVAQAGSCTIDYSNIQEIGTNATRITGNGRDRTLDCPDQYVMVGLHGGGDAGGGGELEYMYVRCAELICT